MRTKTVSMVLILVCMFVAMFGTWSITPISAVLVHDVAVIEAGLYHLYRSLGRVMPLIVPEAYPTYRDPIEFHVTVKNEGDFAETFNVTAYCNNTAIGTQNVTDLAPGANRTLTFSWRPYLPGYHPWYPNPLAWPYPVYVFSANATVVPGETDTADNTYVDGTVKVKWPGDVNGDGHVNIYDLTPLAITWHIIPPHPRYRPRADFDGDGRISIYDLTILALNWNRGPLD